jgi:hypothetical protein
MALARVADTSVPLRNKLLNPEAAIPTFSANSVRVMPESSTTSNSLLVEAGRLSTDFALLPISPPIVFFLTNLQKVV